MHTLAILGIVAALIVLGLILWRNTCPLKHVLNPTHRAGGYATPHALVLAIAFLAVFALGVGATAAYNAGYFTSHYRQNDQPVPTGPAPIYDYKQPGVPASATVQIRALDPIRDQGQVGSCAGQVTAELVGYEWRVNGPHRPWIRLSARYPYSYYSDTYNGGNDDGSTPARDAEVLANLGLIRFNQDPDPPYGIENPLPAFAGVNRLHTPITWHSIADNTGAGYGLVDGIKSAIVAGHPVGIGIQVLHTYDEATQNNGMTDIPLDGNMAVRGGHEIEGIAYNDSIQFRDSAGNVVATGGVLTRGSWGAYFGLHGMVWISYRYLAQYGFLTGYFTLTTSASGPLPPLFVPNHGPKYLPPVLDIPPGAMHTTSNDVHGVVLHDTHYDISNLINYWGHRYGVSPIGIAATAGTESGMNQYADRCCIPGDTSWGTFQFTNGTACGYGICSGIRDALDNPTISVELAARYYRDAIAYHGGRVQFPNAYGLYNAGYGNSDSFYLNLPYGSVAYQNFYGNFLPWWRYSWAYYAGSPAPTPKPAPKLFPVRAWGSLPYRYHGSLSWAASEWLNHYRWLGHDRNRGNFYGHAHGYMQTRFGHGVLRCWPAYHTCKASKR